VVSKALETNRISLNEINSCSSALFRNSARRFAANIAKLPELLGRNNQTARALRFLCQPPVAKSGKGGGHGHLKLVVMFSFVMK
jgi:hypothetical protein